MNKLRLLDNKQMNQTEQMKTIRQNEFKQQFKKDYTNSDYGLYNKSDLFISKLIIELNYNTIGHYNMLNFNS